MLLIALLSTKRFHYALLCIIVLLSSELWQLTGDLWADPCCLAWKLGLCRKDLQELHPLPQTVPRNLHPITLVLWGTVQSYFLYMATLGGGHFPGFFSRYQAVILILCLEIHLFQYCTVSFPNHLIEVYPFTHRKFWTNFRQVAGRWRN